ncbi:cation diffusion facilitator family transporter containing protein, partial [Reticulomyxa filosa]
MGVVQVKKEKVPIGYHEISRTPIGRTPEIDMGQTVIVYKRDYKSVIRRFAKFGETGREEDKLLAGCFACLVGGIYSYDRHGFLYALEAFTTLNSIKSFPKGMLADFVTLVRDALTAYVSFFKNEVYVKVLKWLNHVYTTRAQELDTMAFMSMIHLSMFLRHEDARENVAKSILTAVLKQSKSARKANQKRASLIAGNPTALVDSQITATTGAIVPMTFDNDTNDTANDHNHDEDGREKDHENDNDKTKDIEQEKNKKYKKGELEHEHEHDHEHEHEHEHEQNEHDHEREYDDDDHHDHHHDHDDDHHDHDHDHDHHEHELGEIQEKEKDKENENAKEKEKEKDKEKEKVPTTTIEEDMRNVVIDVARHVSIVQSTEQQVIRFLNCKVIDQDFHEWMSKFIDSLFENHFDRFIVAGATLLAKVSSQTLPTRLTPKSEAIKRRIHALKLLAFFLEEAQSFFK